MGGIVSGVFGSSTPSPPNLQTWQPANTSQADTGWGQQFALQSANNPYVQYQGQAQGILNQTVNNPYAAGAQTAANTAGANMQGAGTQGVSNAYNLGSQVPGMTSAANQVWNTANDPQNALYNQQSNLAQQQAQALAASSGLGTSGAGVGSENQAMQNFNLGWQNNLLNRQATGLQGLDSGMAAASNQANNANTLGASAAQNIAAGGALPGSTYLSNLGSQQNALNNYGQFSSAGNALEGNTMGAAQSYLQGLSAPQANTQANLDLQNWLNQSSYAQQQNQQLSDMVNGGMSFLGNGLQSFAPYMAMA